MIDPIVALRCASYTDVDAVGQGKMWDCKTSKVSQFPLAALNAFGLFAARASGRAKPHPCKGGGRQQFTLRHHAIAAMPISPRDKRSLYKTLSFERKCAERRLGATIRSWRSLGLDTHPGSWKQFLAARTASGDRRAIRRLERAQHGLTIKSDGESTEDTASPRPPDEPRRHHPQPARRSADPRIHRIARAPKRSPGRRAQTPGEVRQGALQSRTREADRPGAGPATTG